MTRFSVCFLVLINFCLASGAFSDYLITSRNAAIKAEPDRTADCRFRLGSGQYLELLDQQLTNRYYHVQLPGTDITGYVYHTLVRRYPGAIPAEHLPAGKVYPIFPITPEFFSMPDAVYLHFVSVGQGDATVVEFPCGLMLVDAGSGPPDIHDSIVPYLHDLFQTRSNLRRDTIDALIITHNHEDHTKDLASVFGAFTVLNYIDNGDEAKDQQKVRDLIDSQGLATNLRAVHDDDITGLPHKYGLSDSIIDPIRCSDADPKIVILSGSIDESSEWWSSAYESQNNQSLTIRIDYGESSVLITGDLEQAALERLVDYYQDTDRLDVDLYHVGHHGAANATTEALVGATTPEIAVISMGDPDYKTGTKSAYAYGHPRDKIITMISSAMSGQRLPQLTAKAAIGAKKFKNILVAKPILGTGWDGTVIVRMASDGEIAVASAKVR